VIILALLVLLILGVACYRCARAGETVNRILHEELPESTGSHISPAVPHPRSAIPRQLGRS
jgi:hypothetical protein